MKKKFFSYVIPSILGFALSGVYAIVDGFFIGNSIGDAGLAGDQHRLSDHGFFTGDGHGNRRESGSLFHQLWEKRLRGSEAIFQWDDSVDAFS